MIYLAHTLVALSLAQAAPAGTDAAPPAYDARQRLIEHSPDSPAHLAVAPFPGTPDNTIPEINSPESDQADDQTAAIQAAASIRLPDRPESAQGDDRVPPLDRAQRSFAGSSAGPLITMGSSLAVCVGLFLLVAWFLRRSSPGGARQLPSEVVQVLGHSPLPGRQQMVLVRCGRRLLLVNVSPTGAETLTEIDDPDEVSHLAAIASGGADPHSNALSFRKTIEQFATAKTTPGFIDEPETALT